MEKGTFQILASCYKWITLVKDMKVVKAIEDIAPVR